MEVNTKENTRYTTAISKGAGMIVDMRCLAQAWRPGEDVDSFAKRVQEENILATYTAYRARDIVRRGFAPRFMRPTDRAARLLKLILDNRLPQKTFLEVMFLFSCRADKLLYDYTTEVYWRTANRGRTVLSIEEGMSFLSEAIADGRIPEAWSETVQVKISRGLLGMLRDVGLVRDRGRATREKEIVSYRLSDESAAVMAYELHGAGFSDSAVCEHPDWRLFGLTRDLLVDRLEAIGEQRGLLVQRGGSVVRITWCAGSTEELFHVLAGKGI